MIEIYIDYAKVLFTTAILIYASWSDWKTREVDDKVWVLFIALTLPLTIIQILTTKFFILNLIYSLLLYFTIIFVLCFVLTYIGFFGGADAKSLLCLALAFPWQPKTIQPLLLKIPPPIFPFSFLTNGLVIFLVVIILVLVKNFLWKIKTGKKLFEGLEHESNIKKFLAVFVGFKVKKQKLKGTVHYSPMEELRKEKDGRIKRGFKISSSLTIEKLLENFDYEKLPEEVWVTPRIPMVIFIFLGFLTAIFLGDFILIFLFNLLF